MGNYVLYKGTVHPYPMSTFPISIPTSSHHIWRQLARKVRKVGLMDRTGDMDRAFPGSKAGCRLVGESFNLNVSEIGRALRIVSL